MGLNQEAKRADALTARAVHGAVGEQWTAALLAELPGGWTVLHGRKLPGFVADYDHVLISPCGTLVVVLDSKRWHAQRETSLVRGRVHCGREDRHGQVTAVARYAERLERALDVPGVSVLPLLVVHGSRVTGNFLSVPVQGLEEPVFVLDPSWLVSTLTASGREAPANPRRAAALVRRVDQVLPRYTG
ncbi:nuclease-related domain-containing protein [Streptomyces sp. NPDC055105]|uniref:nuclease-related domain-containing protein n=1 Tax=Streptomyces sp. NPDC055105 TaxID=3365719 RepID=UPI0037D51A44